MDIDNLDVYYEDCVIGGPGAFVIPIKEREQFNEAIRTKLVLEIAGRTPQARVVPVAAQSRASPAPSASACGSSAGVTNARTARPPRRARNSGTGRPA